MASNEHVDLGFWFTGFFQGVNAIAAPQRDRVLTACARSCLARGAMSFYGELFEQVDGDLDAFFRGDLQSRYSAYATAVQNGFKTRNEVRALENDPPLDGGDTLTAQTNLAPLDKLGVQSSANAPQTPIGEDIKQ